MDRPGSSSRDRPTVDRPRSSSRDRPTVDRPRSSRRDRSAMDRPGSSSRDRSTVDRPRSSRRDWSAVDRPTSGFNAAFNLQSELRRGGGSAPGMSVSSSYQEQSFASLFRRSTLGPNTDTALLQTQTVFLGPLEGRVARENQNQD
ncbi:splicing factor U2AF 65 kDa subunit-like [Cebidichthys violaceus]|uniref:splicing factor U2AF 65 kDa subunit-like n=1 Tax=Cebidichthys violaceus TaxID=271503 RepID=UPI0035CBAB23